MNQKIAIMVLAILLVVPVAFSQSGQLLTISLSPSAQTETLDMVVSGQLTSSGSPVGATHLDIKVDGALLEESVRGLSNVTYSDSSFVGTRTNLTLSNGLRLLHESDIITYNSGTGKDGNLSVTGESTLNAPVYKTSAYLPAGSTLGIDMQLDTGIFGSGIADGNELLIIEVQYNQYVDNTQSYQPDLKTTVGNYEIVKVSQKGGNWVTLESPLKNSYNGTARDVLIQKVPNYDIVSVASGAKLTAAKWNGDKGGILAFRARSLVVDGSIDATGLGFRGGTEGAGEGILGAGPVYNTEDDRSSDGAGGASLDVTSGGGGGTYGDRGSDGSGSSFGQAGPYAYGFEDLRKLYFGSGGGTAFGGSAAGYGGGIIIIDAGSVALNGNIVANGGSASGVAGAGAGGSILLSSPSITGLGSISAVGGTASGIGGSGGYGRVRINTDLDTYDKPSDPENYQIGIFSYGKYLSPVIDLTGPANFTYFSFDADVPAGTSLKFQLRACDSAGCDAPFAGPDGTSSSYYTSASSLSVGKHRYLQYAVFLSSDASKTLTPVLRNVSVNYTGAFTKADGTYSFVFPAPAFVSLDHEHNVELSGSVSGAPVLAAVNFRVIPIENDTTSPSIGTVAMSSVSVESGRLINISVPVTDNIKVNSVSAYIRNTVNTPIAALQLAKSGDTYSATFNTMGVPIGVYLVNISAADLAGNAASSTNAAAFSVVSSSKKSGEAIRTGLSFAANQPVTINLQNEVNAIVTLVSSQSLGSETVSVVRYGENIKSAVSGKQHFKTIEILISSNLSTYLHSGNLTITYLDAEHNTAEIQESSLSVYRWDGTQWVQVSSSLNSVSNEINLPISRAGIYGVFGTSLVPEPAEEEPPATVPETPATSGGGGGGGGGGGSGGASVSTGTGATVSTPTRLVMTRSFNAGDNRITLTNTEIPVKQLVIRTNSRVSNVRLTVENLADVPVAKPASRVFSFIEITPQGLAETDVAEGQIRFQVPSSWLESNGISKENVILLRYHGDEWNELETQLVSETSDVKTYVATTPGFSYFAIAEKAVEQPVVEEPPVVEQPPITGQVTSSGSEGALVLVVVVVLIVIYVVLAKANGRKQSVPSSMPAVKPAKKRGRPKKKR